MFKSFFLIILIMVKSATLLMRKGVEKGMFEANYNCYTFFYNYSILFPEYPAEFIFNIGRSYAMIEEVINRFNIPTQIVFKITYRPPPDEIGKFERDIYRNYCDEFKSKFKGSLSWHCEVGFDEKSCPVVGGIINDLYIHLIRDYIFPFLSRLLCSKFYIESCTPFMIKTKHITLLPSGVLSYRDRFSFSSNVIRFNIDCDHPSKSIRRAINRIISVL